MKDLTAGCHTLQPSTATMVRTKSWTSCVVLCNSYSSCLFFILQAGATGTKTGRSALQMEAQPVTQGIDTELSTTAAAPQNPVRLKHWSEQPSRWSRRKKVDFSCSRALLVPHRDKQMDWPKASGLVSPLSILKGCFHLRLWPVEVQVR